MNTTARMTLSFAFACLLAAPVWADEPFKYEPTVSSSPSLSFTTNATLYVPEHFALRVEDKNRRAILSLKWPSVECDSWRLESSGGPCLSFAPDKKDVGMEFIDKHGRKWRAKWEAVGP